jgi:hypothetical protein
MANEAPPPKRTGVLCVCCWQPVVTVERTTTGVLLVCPALRQSMGGAATGIEAAQRSEFSVGCVTLET